MGKINKYCNIYNVDNELVRKVNTFGILDDYSIKEAEALVDTLDKGTLQYNNTITYLTHLYTNPKTKEDSEYVEKLRKELYDKYVKESAKKEERKNAEARALGVVEKDLEDSVLTEKAA